MEDQNFLEMIDRIKKLTHRSSFDYAKNSMIGESIVRLAVQIQEYWPECLAKDMCHIKLEEIAMYLVAELLKGQQQAQETFKAKSIRHYVQQAHIVF